ncbi:MAG: ABC transporter permease subunit [Roseiflexaceae bacterium]|nr:ABC transporter permease subunit [Roseiflexaceae bacterium]
MINARQFIRRATRSCRRPLATRILEHGPWQVLRATLVLLLAGPILVLGLYALSTHWFYPQVLPIEWTIAPIMRQFSNPTTQAALGSSLQIAGAVTFLALVLGLPAARVLGLRRFYGRDFVVLVLFLPSVVPPLAIGMGLNILFLRLGLAGSVAGVILVHLVPVLPYAIFVLVGIFERYDEGYEWQARTLGASPVRVWALVTLPLAGPGISVAALFAFLVSWSQYILTLLIGGGQVITLPILLFSAITGGNPTTIAALALLVAAPPIVAIALAARMLSTGSLTVAQQS